MAVSMANPLLKVGKNLVVLLVAVLLFEVVWFAVNESLSGLSSNENSVDYSVEAPEIVPTPALDSFQSTINRSLFNWNRRPKSSEPQPVSEESLTSRWQLSGVVNTGNAIYALFSEVSGSRRIRLEQGMYLEKWRVESITPEQVKLINNDDEEEFFYLKETDLSHKSSTVRVNQRIENKNKIENKNAD